MTARARRGRRPDFDGVHASPGVRRLARELDLDLTALSGTGPKGRITKEDVIGAVRGPAAPAAAAAGGTSRDPGGAGAGLLEVRAGRGPAADPHPAAVRARAAPVLAQRPARHPRRRGRHHRPGRLPAGTRHRGQGGGLPGDAARLPDEGQRLRAARIPEVQQLADAGEGRADLQGLLPPRRGGGHTRGPGGAGDPRRGPQGHHGAQPGARRRPRPGRGRASSARPTCRAPASPSPAWAASAEPASRPSSTPPRWPSSAWSGPRWRRCGTVRRSCRG